jgi:hypothetical protein
MVLTRYGGGWRGLKPKLAYEHGAVIRGNHHDAWVFGAADPGI